MPSDSASCSRKSLVPPYSTLCARMWPPPEASVISEVVMAAMPLAVTSAASPPSIAASIVKALANDRRLEIMNWLKNPRAHFPPQVYGDLVKDGVCGIYIAEKLGVSQPTASEHLRILTAAGLIRGKRIKQWTFYKRE